MNHSRQIKTRALLLAAMGLAFSISSRLMRADTGDCSGAMLTLPFIDVPGNNLFFCSRPAGH